MFQVQINGIDAVIRRLENLVDSLETKKKDFLQRLADIGVDTASVLFSNAEYDGTNDVGVEPKWMDDNTIAVQASGKSVLFIEFGAGVFYEEHPQADEFGYHHGTYGQGKGANQKGWIYKGEQGTNGMPVLVYDKRGRIIGRKDGVWRTYGNPPARAMYEASKEMRRQMLDIAKEVFAE